MLVWVSKEHHQKLLDLYQKQDQEALSNSIENGIYPFERKADIKYVSVNPAGEIIALFTASNNKDDWYIDNFYTILFDTKSSITYGRDIIKLYNMLLYNYRFKKICFYTSSANSNYRTVTKWADWIGAKNVLNRLNYSNDFCELTYFFEVTAEEFTRRI